MGGTPPVLTCTSLVHVFRAFGACTCTTVVHLSLLIFLLLLSFI
jgi:hypothetical protein